MERQCKQKFSKYITNLNGQLTKSKLCEATPKGLRPSPQQKSSIAKLIKLWNKKDKSVNDMFEMKEPHSFINGTKLDNDLWTDYVKTTLSYRVSLLKHVHAIHIQTNLPKEALMNNLRA